MLDGIVTSCNHFPQINFLQLSLVALQGVNLYNGLQAVLKS